jgi:formylmethanofuran dehydrogenase subunit A
MVTHDPRVADSADRTIAIRDGRTSSEIGQDDVETVVIDAVGRLQIPIEIRQRLHLGRHATVNVVDGVIHITPIRKESS